MNEDDKRLIGYSEWGAPTQHGLRAAMSGGSAGQECPPCTEHVFFFFLLLPSSATSNPARNVTLDFYNHSSLLDVTDLYVIMKAGL